MNRDGLVLGTKLVARMWERSQDEAERRAKHKVEIGAPSAFRRTRPH